MIDLGSKSRIVFLLTLVTVLSAPVFSQVLFVDVTHSPSNPMTTDTVTLTANGANCGGNGINRITIFVIGPPADKICTFPIGTTSATCTFPSQYQEGTYQYDAYIECYNGFNTFSAEKSFTVTRDTTPPTVFSYHSPQFPVEGNTVTIDVTASDPSGIYATEVFVDGASKKVCYSSTTCSYSAALSPGTHTYYGKAYDNSPLLNSATSGTGSFNVAADTTPPSISAQLVPSNPRAADSVTIVADAGDANRISSISIYTDGQLRRTCTDITSCTYATMYSTGTHNYYAEARDASAARNYAKTSTRSFSVTGMTKNFKIVFVPLNFDTGLGDFNRKADAGFNTFKSVTPFSEQVLSPMLQYQKLDSSCNCPDFAVTVDPDGTRHATYNCKEEVLRCVQDAGINDHNAVVAVLNENYWYGQAFWGSSMPYAVASKYINDDGSTFIITHETLHLFKFCDTYEKTKYDWESTDSTGFGILAENWPYSSCLNPYPLTNGVGYRGSCSAVCNPSYTTPCETGVCGAYLGGSYPYNVDFMGDPMSGSNRIANPVGLDAFGYASMREMLVDYGFSSTSGGGCGSVSCAGSDYTSVMELTYTINTNNQVSLISAKKTFSDTLITPSSSNEYSIHVYSTSGQMLFNSPIEVSFTSADGDALSETTLYQRIPWVTGAEHVIISHNDNWIAEWDLKDTDDDSYPDLADNCPTLTNTDQKNTDKEIQDNDMVAPFFIGDNMGNVCDADDDNDGYFDRHESMFIGTNPLDPCGTDGWPADLHPGSGTFGYNKIDIQDITSFLAPIKRLNTNVGDYPNNARWDLVIGKQLFSTDINIADLTNLITLQPPMFGSGVRAFNGPECPIPP